jgi:uncharacterized protein YndB with AHSA1/START domain
MGTSQGKHNDTAVERTSDQETVVTRRFNAPARLVFKAWTTPELLLKWWTPKSFDITFVSCEVDARTGGGYKFVFRVPSMEQPMAFFGKYLEVVPDVRLVWTNEEGGEDGPVTTVTFEEHGGGTLLTVHDRYPSKKALDDAIATESMNGFGETFDQLDALLPELGAA